MRKIVTRTPRVIPRVCFDEFLWRNLGAQLKKGAQLALRPFLLLMLDVYWISLMMLTA